MDYIIRLFFPPSQPVRPGLCNRLQRLPLSLSSFSITPCPCAGHQMTSSPPEELSSFLISAAAWLSPGQQPATQGEGTSACLRIRDRLAHYPSVSPSDWTPHVTAPLPPCYSGENTGI
ncbi:Mediator of RNA polymerase II transcription subunit 14 [Dissostichus eleginoides]|uniref:Mediator of RNA polymerase II transcription subunit 14 n=2 Tax=Notothenioidei TaxID=8205 RepID=A0AAD9CNT7_DISEL|nr:Mediator of RNA polymerase II transcription subunit 14 [Dissostichus eleginoides]